MQTPIRNALLGSALVLLAAFAPAPARAQYEIVQGFDDLPPKGPAAALGLVIWNHGVKGNQEQGTSPPPTFIRQLVQAGWDAVRIKRDGLNESNWTTAGLRHVKRTVEEVESATAKGYKRIVLAGQSYGGAITLEAARRIPVYAIVPSAPGTGVSATSLGSPMIDAQGTAHLYDSLKDGRFERAVPILPFADEFASASPERGARAREILTRRGIAFLPMDDISTQLVGHGGSGSSLMHFAYGACVVAFLDPARTPTAGLNACGGGGLPPSPDVLGETASLKPMAMEGGTWWKWYEGVWVGAWNNPLLVSLAIEKGPQGPEIVYLVGKANTVKLDRTYRAAASLEGTSIVAKLPHQNVALTFENATRQAVLTWRNAEGKTGSLRLKRYAAGGS